MGVGNQYKEHWTFEKAKELFEKALGLARQKESYSKGEYSVKGYSFHFLGEIASELDTYLDVFTYLIDKYNELKEPYKKLKTRLESNCFADSKKGIIKEASAIMNLKSNYGWTDRMQNDHTTQGEKIESIPPISWIKEDEKEIDE